MTQISGEKIPGEQQDIDAIGWNCIEVRRDAPKQSDVSDGRDIGEFCLSINTITWDHLRTNELHCLLLASIYNKIKLDIYTA